nr:hypothetical protein [Tanacetum cinerariifolium]
MSCLQKQSCKILDSNAHHLRQASYTPEKYMLKNVNIKLSMEEEEVPLVDGVFEGALGALALEMKALVDAMVVDRDEEDGEVVICI